MKAAHCVQARLKMHLLLAVGLARRCFGVAEVHGATLKKLHTHAWIPVHCVLTPSITQVEVVCLHLVCLKLPNWHG